MQCTPHLDFKGTCRVTVPFQRQFWGEHYGNFTDRFGVQWAVSSRAKATVDE
jgi:uncharacterized glyoxalase superfamily protein PhnB